MLYSVGIDAEEVECDPTFTVYTPISCFPQLELARVVPLLIPCGHDP